MSFCPCSNQQGGFGWGVDLEPEHSPLHRRIAVEFDLVGVETDRQQASEQSRQLGGARNVVEVAVGVEDHGRPETRRPHTLGDPLTLVAGVDHHHLPGSSVAEEHAVCLNGTHCKNVEKERFRHLGETCENFGFRISDFGFPGCCPPGAPSGTI